MEEFALIKSRVNLNRVDLGIALISDLKVYGDGTKSINSTVHSLWKQYSRVCLHIQWDYNFLFRTQFTYYLRTALYKLYKYIRKWVYQFETFFL